MENLNKGTEQENLEQENLEQDNAEQNILEQGNEGQENAGDTPNTPPSNDVPSENSTSKGKGKNELKQKIKIERTTAIKKVHATKTLKKLAKATKEELRFDLCIQRGSVWTPQQKGLFIHSLIYGYPFPPVYAQDLGDGVLWFLDGKQRLTTGIDYVNDGFKLHKDTPSCFGVEIAGLKFSQLPEQFQDEIKDTTFTIYMMKDMTTEERDQMFVRLNRGTPLAKIESTRALYSDLIEQIEMIANLEFFSDHVMLSNSAKNRFTDQELILQTAMLLQNGYEIKGIGSVQIQNYVTDLKKKDELLGEEIVQKFIKASEYLSIMANELTEVELKSICKKVNVPMIILTALKAIENDINESVFGDFLVSFLIRNYNKESIYGKACQSGSAKKENVIIRLTEMDKAFVDFVNKRIDEQSKKIESNQDENMGNVG